MRFTRFFCVIVMLSGLAFASAPAAAEFDPPVNLSDDGVDSGGPKVVMRPAGDAYIVWERGGIVQGRPSIAGAFGATQTLSTAGASSPAVAMNAMGTTIVVWSAQVDDDSRIQATRGAVNTGFNPPENVSPAGSNAGNAQIAINANGDAVIAWEREGGRIFARFRSSGGAYGPVAAVSPSAETASAPKVVIAADGSAVVVWSVEFGKIKARARSSSGVWGPVKLIDPAYSVNPDIAMTPAGNALIVWQSGTGIKARTRSPTGVYSAISPMSDTYVANGPRVAMNAKGNALVVWATSLPTGGLPRVYVRYRSAAGVLGPLQAITPANRGSFIPQVAINAKGAGVIVYAADINPDVVNGDRIARARTRSPTGTFGPAENLSAVGADAFQIGVGIATDGSAVATWRRQDTSSYYTRIQAAVGE